MNQEILTFLSKSRYLRNLIRDKQLIFSVMLIIFSWAIVYLFLFYKAGYESNATVWIKNLATEEYVASLDNQSSQLTPLTAAGNPILSQIEILKSEKLKVGVAAYKSKLLGKIINPKSINIEVKNKINTDMLGLSYVGSSPTEAKATLSEILKEYEDINLSINKKVKTNRRLYIDSKLDEITKKLYDIRGKIKNYKMQTLSISLEEQSRELVEQQILFSSELENTIADIKNTNSSIREAEKQLSLKTKEAISAVALGSGNQNLTKLREDLNTAIQQYEFDSAKLAETNPAMVAQKNKINTINAQIKKQIELSIGKYAKNQKINIYDPVRENMVRELAENQTKLLGLQAKEKSLSDSIKKINSEQAKIPEQKFNLDNLEQEEKALSTAYDQLKEKQIEAKIKEAEAVSNIVVVDSPSLPKGASFPTAFQTICLALMFGFVTGILVSILKTYLEDVCDDIESIEEITNASAIGTIPWIEEVISEDQVKNIHGLAYDSIVSNLTIKCYKGKKKALTFTSSSLKKSQPTITYQIAMRLKKSGHSVVIVDSDFRIPTTLKALGVEDKVKTNLSDLIIILEKKFEQQQDFVSNREVLSNLVEDDLGINHLGNKDSVFEPYELYGTKAFEHIIDTLKKKFDWVLIDTGVAHITPEFLIISKIADGVVLYIDKTITYTTLKAIAKQLKNANISFVGTIIRESGSAMRLEYEKYLTYLKDKTDQEASN